MPKIVDHGQRRAAITRAFTDQVAAHGWAAASYAATARGAGCSVGTIQHYFDERRDLVRAAFEAVVAERDARMAATVDAAESQHEPIREILGRALLELLPTDAARRREHAMTLQLRVEALQDPLYADIAAAADRDISARVARAVENGIGCGEVSPGTDVTASAERILAVTRGLALTLTPDAGSAVPPALASVVAGVFTGRCRRHDGPDEGDDSGTVRG